MRIPNQTRQLRLIPTSRLDDHTPARRSKRLSGSRARYGVGRVDQRLSVAVRNPTTVEVVGGKLDGHTVAWQHTDIVRAHLAGKVGEHPVAVFKFDRELRVRQRVDNLALDADGVGVLATGSLLRRRAGRDGTGRASRTVGGLLRQRRFSW